MCWTPLYARKHIYNFRVLFTGFHGIDTKCYIWLAQLYNVNICCLVKSIIVSFSYFLCYHLLKQTLLENNRLLQSLWGFFQKQSWTFCFILVHPSVYSNFGYLVYFVPSNKKSWSYCFLTCPSLFIHIEPHQWCNGQYAYLQCSRS